MATGNITLVPCTFLGKKVGGGVIVRMRDSLAAVEAALKTEYNNLNPGMPFIQWCGINGIGGFREHGGPHTKGIAVDLDYTENPYIAIRTGTHFGGEAAGASLGVRVEAIEACDRIMGGTTAADLACRRSGESTELVWDRLNAVSVGWKNYFSPYFNNKNLLVRRKPIYNWQTCDVNGFAAMVTSKELIVDINTVPIQILRDYEAVRIPTVVGTPSKYPATTRNPARGFLTHPKHVAVAMCKVGNMRWGACDFGYAESGDIMHYDLSGR